MIFLARFRQFASLRPAIISTKFINIVTENTNPSRAPKLSPHPFYVLFIPAIPQEVWCLYLCVFCSGRGAALHPGGKDPRSYTNGARGGLNKQARPAGFRGSCCHCHITGFVMQETHRSSFHWAWWRFTQILILLQINSHLQYGNKVLRFQSRTQRT